MDNIFRQDRGENRIFRDESALLPDFLPDELPGREREIRELVYCVQPAAENRQPEHALLAGPPGTGKTSVARFVLKQLSEYSQRPLTVYINCWECQSRPAILGFLATAIGEPMPRRGIATDEVFSRIIEITKKEGRIPIIVLDEVDRLEAQEDGVQVLYDLCRAGEAHSLKTGVIAITNDTEFHTRLDSRVRSSFVQHTLEFSPYAVPQLKEILSRRAKLGFLAGSLDPEVIPLCAAISIKHGGDARVALSLLLSAGKAAERENAQKVLVQHVRKTEEQSLGQSSVKAERKLPGLDEVDQEIVEAVKKAGKSGMESGRLYELLSKYGKDRALRGRIDRLEQSGILETEMQQLPMGRTRIIRLSG
jgi:archaeal cell division control protein 6